MWYVFFNKMYIWSCLLKSSNDHTPQEKFTEKAHHRTNSVAATDDIDVIEGIRMEQVRIEKTTKESLENVSNLRQFLSLINVNATDCSKRSFKSKRRNSFPLMKSITFQPKRELEDTKPLMDSQELRND